MPKVTVRKSLFEALVRAKLAWEQEVGSTPTQLSNLGNAARDLIVELADKNADLAALMDTLEEGFVEEVEELSFEPEGAELDQEDLNEESDSFGD